MGVNKEENGDDFCFYCKDGGMLRFCDHKDCLKAYHPDCVGEDDSFMESEDRWICDWHSCFNCRKASKFRCFSCPQAVCGRCISHANFVRVRGCKGFCNHCLKLTLLIENGEDADSDGLKIDFDDQDTYEYLFKAYWQLIKEKEGLMPKHVHTASNLMKKKRLNDRCGSNSNETDESEEDSDDYDMPSDYEELEVTEEAKKLVRKGKKSKEKPDTMRKKTRTNNREFIGWGSKPVINFLSKIGKDTSKELTQHDVTSIIKAYCKGKKLFDPHKKKKILCDAELCAVFRRKSVNTNSIYNLLTAHFYENVEHSSDDESISSTEEKNDNSVLACTRPSKLVSCRKLVEKKPSDVMLNCFSSIVAENIKLIYLKRSLVEELLNNLQCFEGKMVGSFIRVKSDPNDYSQNNSYQLLLVTGVKIDSSNTNDKRKILLQVSNRIEFIPIYNLSDDDFSKEECEDLCKRVRNGLLKNPTVAELYEKSKSLHEDITKHWIAKELARLQTCIDQANEKGWRRELSVYMEKRILLQKPSEQARLLHEFPEVMAEIPEPTADDLLKKDKQVNHELLDERADKKDATEECRIDVPPIQEKQQHFEASSSKDSARKLQIPPAESPKHQTIHPKEQTHSRTPAFNTRLRTESIKTQPTKLRSKDVSAVQLIDLSDDEEDNEKETEVKKRKSEDMNSSMWYCEDAEGERRGPLPMAVLKRWKESNTFDVKSKVWRRGQSSAEAILLNDAIQLFYTE